MIPTYIGTAMAFAFLLITHLAYGHEVNSSWVGTVFWSLIGTGLLTSAVNRCDGCVACVLLRRLRCCAAIRWLRRVCAESHCAGSGSGI